MSPFKIVNVDAVEIDGQNKIIYLLVYDLYYFKNVFHFFVDTVCIYIYAIPIFLYMVYR